MPNRKSFSFSSLYSNTALKIGAVVSLFGILFVSWSLDSKECSFVDFLLNAGTELLGIAITILFVQMVLDSIQKKADLKSLTWDILIDADYAVWVWQGGERVFNLEELAYLIDQITPTDPFPATTQNIVLALGNKASNLLRTQQELIRNNRDLEAGLMELKNLARIRDQKKVKPPQEIAEILKTSVAFFAKVLDEKFKIPQGVEYERNSEASEQIWRHTGERFEPFSGDSVDIKSQVKIGQGVN